MPNKQYEPSKFRKFNHNPVNVDLGNFRKVIAEFRPHLTCAEAYKIRSIENLKRAYRMPHTVPLNYIKQDIPSSR
jgi:hypothetical protein